MADEINIKLSATGNASKELKKLARSLVDIDNNAKQTGKVFKKNADKIAASSKRAANAARNMNGQFVKSSSIFKGALGANLATKAILALGQSLREAFRNGQEFSAGVAEVNSLLGENEQLTKKTTDQFIEFSSQFGTSAADQAKAFYQIISAGVSDTAEATKVLIVANKAAVAGLSSVETAVRVISATVNTYASDNLTASQASDILFATVKSGITNFEALANNIGKVAPIAQAAGISFAELAGTLAFLTKSGLSTEEASTGLKSVITGLLKPSDQAKASFAALGVSFGAAALKTKGLQGILGELRKATGGNIDTLGKLFPNVRALGPIASIVKGNFEDFVAVLGSTNNALGATDAAFQRVTESASFAIQQFGSSFDALGVQIFSNLEEVIALFARFGTEIINEIRDITNNAPLLIGFFRDVVVAADLLLRGFTLTFNLLILPVQAFAAAFAITINEIVQLAALLPGSVGEEFKEFAKITDKSAVETVKRLEEIKAGIADAAGGDSRLLQLAQKLDVLGNEAKKGFGRFSAGAKAAADASRELQAEMKLQEQVLNKLLETQISAGAALANAAGKQSEILKLQTAEVQLEFEQQLINLEEFNIAKNEIENIRFQTEIENLNKAREANKVTQEQFDLAVTASVRKRNIAIGKLDVARNKNEAKQAKERTQNIKSSLDAIGSLTASSDKRLFAIGKASRLATAIIDGIAAVQKALAVGFPLSLALVPAVTAASLANVAKIAQSKPPKLQDGIDSVPGPFNVDQFPAILAGGERVVPARSNQDLTEFLSESRGSQELLSQIAAGISNLTSNINVNIGGETITAVVRRQIESGDTIEVQA